jgi:multiple sugar transport system substrate-binding protein
MGLTRRAYVLGSAGAAGAALAACVPGRAPAAPTSAKQLSGTVQVLDFELSSPAAKERWDKTVARFRERFPGITLIEDRSRNDSQWEKLPAAVAAGTPPDTAPLRRIQDFPSMVGRGALLALDTYLANSRVVKRADFYDRVLAMHAHEGKLYALPSSIAIYLWYFNKSLFQANGMKPPDLTWDYNDLDDVAAKLTRKSGDDFVQAGLQIPTWWPNHHMGNRDVAPWQGGILEKGTCARANYDRPEVVDAYEWFQKHICRQRTAEPDSATSRTAFERGNVAMLLSTVRLGEFNDKIGTQFEWDVTLQPLGDKKKARVQTMGGSGHTIFKESKVADHAWAFVEFLSDPEMILEQVRTEGALQVYPHKRVMESKEFQSSKLPPTDKSLFSKGLEAGKMFPQPDWEMRALGVNPPPTDVGKVTTCAATPRDALMGAANVINGALKQAGFGCP